MNQKQKTVSHLNLNRRNIFLFLSSVSWIRNKIVCIRWLSGSYNETGAWFQAAKFSSFLLLPYICPSFCIQLETLSSRKELRCNGRQACFVFEGGVVAIRKELGFKMVQRQKKKKKDHVNRHWGFSFCHLFFVLINQILELKYDAALVQ